MKATLFQKLCWILYLLTTPVHGQQDRDVTVTLQAPQDIRGIAKSHLNDPDLWPDILSANELQSVQELRPGMRLKIPVGKILGLKKQLSESRRLIHQATQAGAGLFASDEIAESIHHYSVALTQRREGEWAVASHESELAIQIAQEALMTSLANRDVPVEAALDEAVGKVQRRRPTDLYWKNAAVKALLAERDRLRTLSNSFAAIVFRDASRLRLNENSQIMIKRIRQDRLKRRESASVVLYDGDIHALLGVSGKRQQVNIQVKGIESKVRSNNYWIANARNATRLANYNGQIEVSSGGAEVVIGKDEGTLVKNGGAPSPPAQLPAAPKLQRPEIDATVYRKEVNFAWTAEDKAVSYWLEVAKDPAFRKLLVNRQQIDVPACSISLPADGLYYWRVCAFDAAGLPGPKSQARVFTLHQDTQAPYLVILAPQSHAQLQEGTVQMRGKTESQATLTVNGEPVALGADGEFNVEYPMQPGENTIVFESRDPAGNLTRLEHSVHSISNTRIPVYFDRNLARLSEGHFVVNRPLFTLSGRTRPGAAVKVNDGQASGYEAATFADPQGRFMINLTAQSDTAEFGLIATLPTGIAVEKRFRVSLDTVPPEILMDKSYPATTRTELLPLSGQVKGGVRLSINANPIPISASGRFNKRLTLKHGANELQLSATDLAGNTTVWRKQIRLDREPPELLDYTLSKKQAHGGDSVQVVVRARDASGLKTEVPFRLSVGDYTHQGHLRPCPDKRCFRNRLVLHQQATGPIKLDSIRLEDYLSNSQEYRFD